MVEFTGLRKLAKMHALQKQYRGLLREINVDGVGFRLEWSGRDQVQMTGELRQALDAFTTPTGREVTNWSKKSPSHRIAEIKRKYRSHKHAGLVSGLFALYRDASEVAHGSLFGVLVHLGLNSPRRLPFTVDGVRSHHRSLIGLAKLSLGVTLHDVFTIVALDTGSDCSAYTSRRNLEQLKNEERCT